MTGLDYYLLHINLMTASAWAMLLWCAAYYLFPLALWRIERIILARTSVRVFGEHVTGTRKFVLWCGHSHLCMWAIMLTHHNYDPGLYEVSLGFVSLAVFVIGGLFSVYRAIRLWGHVPLLAGQIVDLIGATRVNE